MKTQNILKTGLAVLALVTLVSGTLKAGINESANAMVSLEIFVLAQEEALKYIAPVIDVETELAVENLEMFAAAAQTDLKYQAPAEDEAIEAVPAMEKLEMLAESTISSLKYQAPVHEDEIYDVTGETLNDTVAETR